MIEWNYDKKADVMYISFDGTHEAISHEVEEGIYLEKHIDSGKWCGLTIVDFSKRCSIKK